MKITLNFLAILSVMLIMAAALFDAYRHETIKPHSIVRMGPPK